MREAEKIGKKIVEEKFLRKREETSDYEPLRGYKGTDVVCEGE